MSLPSKRIYFVDFARSFAIMLALTDHSMNDFGMVPANIPLLKLITSSATPTFLLLFGMMLEIIYLGRLRKFGIRKTAYGLINRSFQCYIGYFLTVVAGVIGGLQDVKAGLGAALFVGNCHFGNILKLYTVMLLVAIPLLWFRSKYGIWKTLLLGLSPWLIYPFLQMIPPFQPNLEIFTSYMFGFGDQGGPSVLYSLTLVTAGMLAASFISFDEKLKFYFSTLGILAVLVTVVVIVFMLIPAPVLTHNHLRNIYRDENNPLYYLFSTTLGLTVAFLSAVLIPIGARISGATHTFMAFGRSSLTAFTAGNIILNLIAARIVHYQWNFLAPMTFVITVFLILQFYEKVYPKLVIVSVIQRAFRGLTVRYHWYYVRRFAKGFVRILG
ncbi:MAG TPA: OpgC domain-containing protein [Ohtaekwangia sp.]|nr:OpgC domain-containing protein [Ohtaekwangia sp.]